VLGAAATLSLLVLQLQHSARLLASDEVSATVLTSEGEGLALGPRVTVRLQDGATGVLAQPPLADEYDSGQVLEVWRNREDQAWLTDDGRSFLERSAIAVVPLLLAAGGALGLSLQRSTGTGET
jgi:hypothetical protein